MPGSWARMAASVARKTAPKVPRSVNPTVIPFSSNEVRSGRIVARYTPVLRASSRSRRRSAAPKVRSVGMPRMASR